jgi:uncharacterized membrane-anchored protein
MNSNTIEPTASKVAKVTLAFWVMKICATTVGETAGDMFSMTLNIGYAASSVLLIAFFLAMLFMQMRAKAFNPVLYWLVILATSTAGTTVSDFMDRTLQLGYTAGASILVSILIATLAVWRLTTGSISVSDIRERKVELFYWIAILASNTLGTAFGDFLADTSGLGYIGSNLLISAALLLIIGGFAFTTISKTILFWAAFVLTRPFGATMGDLLTKTPAKGGMGFGTIGSSAILLGLLAALVLWDMRRLLSDKSSPEAVAA